MAWQVVSFLLKELAVGSSTALSPDIATRDAAEQRLVEEVLAEVNFLAHLYNYLRHDPEWLSASMREEKRLQHISLKSCMIMTAALP